MTSTRQTLFIRIALGLLCLPPVPAFTTPVISADRTEIDFGEARSGEKIEKTFRISNEGTSLLRISQIESSCGCATMAARTLQIPPGESEDLPVVIDLDGRRGRQSQIFRLHTNDPQTSVKTLRLVGYAVSDVELEPRTLHMDSSGGGSKLQGVITVRSTTGEPIELKNVESARGRLEWEADPAEDGLSIALTVRPVDQESEGHATDVLQITTSNRAAGTLRALVLWQRRTGVSVAPGQMNLVYREGVDASDRYLIVRNHMELEEPFKLTAAEWPGRDVEVSLEDSASLGWRVRLHQVQPDPGMDGEELVIRTNAPGFEELRIPVRIVRP